MCPETRSTDNMGRPPIGTLAMSEAERKRRQRHLARAARAEAEPARPPTDEALIERLKAVTVERDEARRQRDEARRELREGVSVPVPEVVEGHGHADRCAWCRSHWIGDAGIIMVAGGRPNQRLLICSACVAEADQIIANAQTAVR
jgi:hypothetical protein